MDPPLFTTNPENDVCVQKIAGKGECWSTSKVISEVGLQVTDEQKEGLRSALSAVVALAAVVTQYGQ